jgi:hypothetical protein
VEESGLAFVTVDLVFNLRIPNRELTETLNAAAWAYPAVFMSEFSDTTGLYEYKKI